MILSTGTFAWQSFSQEATNEIIQKIDTPGARLHDYFDGSDKDVFVENYAEGENVPNVYARIRLREYFEYGKNAGTTDATNITIARGDIQNTTPILGNVDSWDIYDLTADNSLKDDSIRSYRDLVLGGETVYLPTFNGDNDDKTPDINGTFLGTDGDGDVNSLSRYDDYVEYIAGTEYDVYKEEISPADGSGHIAANTNSAKIYGMEEWIKLGAPIEDAWVFDKDGWAYYTAPITAGTASGLLLDGIELIKNPSEEWYYAVDVEAQLATAGDWGKADDMNVTSSMYASDMTTNGMLLLNRVAGINLGTGNLPELDVAAVGNLVEIDDVEWIVIDRTITEVQLLANEVVGPSQAFHGKIALGNLDSTWGTSDLRAYLNGDAYINEYLPSLKSSLKEVELITSLNTNISGDTEMTKDKVFLLTMEDFGWESDATNGTPTVLNPLVPSDYITVNKYEWLRTPQSVDSVYIVNPMNSLVYDSTAGLYAIRPALWVTL